MVSVIKRITSFRMTNPFSKAADSHKSDADRTTLVKKDDYQGKYSSQLPEYPNVGSLDFYWLIYKNIPQINAAIEIITNAVVANGYEIRPKGKSTRAATLKRVEEVRRWYAYPDQPEPFENVIRDVTRNLMIYDNSFIEIRPYDTETQSAGWQFPLDSRDCKFTFNSRGTAVETLVHKVKNAPIAKLSTEETVLTKEEFIHLAMNKAGSVFGLSPIETLIREADLEELATQYNLDQFSNNGVPAMFYSMITGNHEDYKQFKNDVRRIGQGQSLVAKGEINAIPIGASASEMGYAELIDKLFQKVLSVFQIPSFMFGYGQSRDDSREGANAFNLKIQAVQRIINWSQNLTIIRCWGEKYEDVEFVLNEPIHMKALATLWEIGVKNGWLVPNDIRKKLNMPDIKGGDLQYVQNFMPYISAKVDWKQLESNNENTPKGEGGQAGEVSRPNREGETKNETKSFG